MQGAKRVSPDAESQAIQDGTVVRDRKKLRQSIDDDVAHGNDTKFGNPFVHQQLLIAVKVAVDQVGHVIDNDAIFLFGHAPVEAAAAAFDVDHGYITLGDDESGENGVRVTQVQHGVGLQPVEQFCCPLKQQSGLMHVACLAGLL